MKEHIVQTYKCEYRENCAATSLTYDEDLGWRTRIVTDEDVKNKEEVISVTPHGGGLIPIDCFTPCMLLTF